MATEVRKRKLSPDRSTNIRDPDEEDRDTIRTSISNSKTFLIRSVVVIFTTIIVFIVWPTKVDPKSFHFHEPPAFEGPLSPNDRLSKMTRLHKYPLIGPESLAVHDGYVYAGTGDGKIIRIKDGHIEVIAQFGSSCVERERSEECGRPLGLRADSSGKLLVVDCYKGLISVNPKDGTVNNLISANRTINGHRSKFLNDVVTAASGKIYVTDTSVKWSRKEYGMIGLEMNPDGRIIEYDPHTGEIGAVCTNVSANGIDISNSEDYLIFAETNFARLSKCYVKGEKRGHVEPFLDNLPGLPDNLRRTASGSYWVALTLVRHPSESGLSSESYAPYPMLRLWRYKLDVIKSVLWGRAPRRKKTYGMVVEIDAVGRYKRSLHDKTGKIVGISHAEEHEGKLYLSSFQNNFVGVVDLDGN